MASCCGGCLGAIASYVRVSFLQAAQKGLQGGVKRRRRKRRGGATKSDVSSSELADLYEEKQVTSNSQLSYFISMFMSGLHPSQLWAMHQSPGLLLGKVQSMLLCQARYMSLAERTDL